MNELIEVIRDAAKDTLAAERKLKRLHAGQIRRMDSGAMTRASTTTYNARAGDVAESLTSAQRELKRACRQYLGVDE